MSVHPLLAPLSEPQQAVVEIVWTAWRTPPSRFPVYAHVEREMDRRGFALEAVLPTFPGIGESQIGLRYRAVSWDALSHAAPDRPVGLSVIGLVHVADSGADSVIKLFLEVLSGLADRRLGAVSDPFTAEDPTASKSDLLQALSRGRDPNFIPDLFGAAQSLAEYEPATSGTGWATASAADSLIRCTRNVRYFRAVRDVPDYLARLDAYLAGPPSPAKAVLDEPPLALAAELDFLDAVWRLHYDKNTRLLNLPSASAVSTLANDAQSAEEFDARMNALGQVLKAFQVQAAGSHPVERLRARLCADLEEASRERIESAATVLAAAVAVRNGAAHVRAAPEAVHARKSLGVPDPITDWRAAWRTVRSAVTRAIATLREELQAND